MNKHHTYNYDLIVIGTGSGGGVGANFAASMGKKVAIVEKDTIGGECPNFGCVPTKALLFAAERYQSAKDSGSYGVYSRTHFNYSHVRAWKDLVVSRTGTAQGAAAFKDAGIDVLHGEAKFVSPQAIRVGKKIYTAKHFLIATGSTVAVPPIPGLDTVPYHTYRDAIDYRKPPKSIFIIGGGPIGCEFAQIFSSFGSKVYIADGFPRLLGREDADAGLLLGEIFKSRGIELFLDCQVNSIRTAWHGKKVIEIKTKHGTKHVSVSHILVATGKRPAVTSLNLEKAGVTFDKGGIKVNREMRTRAKHIYAAGDVVGPYLFTHTGEYQSNIAVHNMFSSEKIHADYRAVPRCTYTSPEVASVGHNEETARAEKIKVRVGSVPLNIIGRANTADENNGFVKIITDSDGIVIGSAIVAPRAGEMIHELALAVRLRLHVKEIADTIHAYPTYSEAVKFAASVALHAPVK